MEWYKKTKDEILSQLQTSIDEGLTQNEAEDRIKKYGPNELKEEDRKSFISKLMAQFKDFLVIILIIASIISFAVGERADAIVILAIVIINALLGLYQEGKAEKALEALKKMAAPNAKVIRDGNVTTVPAIL